MVELANAIDWQNFEDSLVDKPLYKYDHAFCPFRLMFALHNLKYAIDMSDEVTLVEWLENPYWRYFYPCDLFAYKYPLDRLAMSRRRKKLARSGAEKMLEEVLQTGLREGSSKKTELTWVNVNSTRQKPYAIQHMSGFTINCVNVW